MEAGRVESELDQQCKTVWKIRTTVGQGKVVRVRKGRRLELDEGSTEASKWAERLLRRKLWGGAGTAWARRQKAEHSSGAGRLYNKGMLVKQKD